MTKIGKFYIIKFCDKIVIIQNSLFYMNGLHTRTESYELLGLKNNQFDYLIRNLNISPMMRTGSKHSVTLYSDQQLHEIRFAMELRKSRYTFEIIRDIIQLARKTDYSNDLWLVTSEDSNDYLLCTDDELPEITAKLSKTNNSFVCGKIELLKPTYKNKFVIGQLQLA